VAGENRVISDLPPSTIMVLGGSYFIDKFAQLWYNIVKTKN
jgi:hypothetical protein